MLNLLSSFGFAVGIATGYLIATAIIVAVNIVEQWQAFLRGDG